MGKVCIPQLPGYHLLAGFSKEGTRQLLGKHFAVRGSGYGLWSVGVIIVLNGALRDKAGAEQLELRSVGLQRKVRAAPPMTLRAR